MPYAELQRVALAAAFSVSANNHFDPSCTRDRGSVVGAIIRDHEDAVERSDLRLNIPNGGKYLHPLVMCGNQYGRG